MSRALPLRITVVLAALSLATPAAAQVGGLGPGGFSPPTPSQGKGKKPPKKPEEETHAASNAESVQAVQTQEPSLPQNPTEVPPEIKERIGTDFDKENEPGKSPKLERDWYGLYYQERSGGYRFRTAFPFWAERTLPGDRASIFGLYYNRRSKDHDADVLFPLFWKTRDFDMYTTGAFPFVHRESKGTPTSPARHDNWLFPLFFEGGSADGSGYFHAPLLLTFTKHSARDGLDVVGPMYCKWRGGPDCDPRTTDAVDMGLPPFYFYGRDEASEYEVIPPLLHVYRYTELGDKSLNIWGPVVTQHSPDSDTLDVFPFFWRTTGKDEASTTVFPLFHYSYKGLNRTLVTPLFVAHKDEDGSKLVASWLYARYRGRTELDMWTPLYWQYRDPDIGLDRKLFFPFFYKNDSPRSHDLVVMPFYAHLQRVGVSDTTWVTPLFRHVHDITGWETDLFPLFLFGRSNQSSHTIVAPFLWDFATPHSRFTLALPFYFRMSDDTSVTQVAFNTYYHEKQVAGGTDWEFHFFPLFSYGQSPTGHFWNVLYGLTGYSREGTSSRMKVLYIPFKLSD